MSYLQRHAVLTHEHRVIKIRSLSIRRRRLKTATGNVNFLWRRHCACTTRCDGVVSKLGTCALKKSFVLTPSSLLLYYYNA